MYSPGAGNPRYGGFGFSQYQRRKRERVSVTTQCDAGEIVDDLVELGYVERIPDAADRAQLIRLTEKAQSGEPAAA